MATKSECVSDYIVLDTETTGLSCEKNEIIELSAYKVKGGQIYELFSTLVKPKRKISQKVTDLTGITNKMVADAPSIADVIPEFVEFADKLPLVGHNLKFDMGFIDAAYGKRMRNQRIDTLSMSRTLNPDLDSHKLGDVYGYLQKCGMPQTPEKGSAHRAAYDAAMTHSIYEFMKRDIDDAREAKRGGREYRAAYHDQGKGLAFKAGKKLGGMLFGKKK